MSTLAEKVIKPKAGLLELAKQLGNVSQACKYLGYSRDSYYRFQKLYAEGGEYALRDLNRSRPNIKNRVPEHLEEAIVNLAKGSWFSGSGVRSVWLRNDLESFKKRLKALEAKFCSRRYSVNRGTITSLGTGYSS